MRGMNNQHDVFVYMAALVTQLATSILV